MSESLEIPDYGDIKELIRRGEQVAAMDLVLKLREACVALREQLQAANERIQGLEEQVKLQAKVFFKDNVCWIEGDSNPICPVCWEDEHKPVHLNGPYPQGGGGIAYDCKKHDKIFHTRLSSGSDWFDSPSEESPYIDVSKF